MTSYTDEQVRDWHLHQLKTLKESWQPYEHHQMCADAIDRMIADRTRLQAEVEALRSGLAPEVEYAWRCIARVSGSALLAGEKKAQTSEQRAVVYAQACQALIATGNVFFELTGKHPGHDGSDEAIDSARAKKGGCMSIWAAYNSYGDLICEGRTYGECKRIALSIGYREECIAIFEVTP